MSQGIFLERIKERNKLLNLLQIFPVTAIIGPRQVGKTTIAKTLDPDFIFDLENPRDYIALENPQSALEGLKGLVMIDEIQRKPDLFPLMRYLVDQNPALRFLILGSASASLRRQSGESLAGRIGYHYLSGLNLSETGNMQQLWLRGGFPRSYLSDTNDQSLSWRNNFIATFLERDLAVLGVNIPASVMYRFWLMLSHYHGQILNYSELGRSFGVSDHIVKRYMGILEDTFMIRLLSPWYINIGKRLVKSPKLYIRDAGIFHALQSIPDRTALNLHPKLGASWEGFALETAIQVLEKRDSEIFFYAAHSGVELDLYWQNSGNNFGIECKYMDVPKKTHSMLQAIQDLKLLHLWVLYPGDREYKLDDTISVLPLNRFEQKWENYRKG